MQKVSFKKWKLNWMKKVCGSDRRKVLIEKEKVYPMGIDSSVVDNFSKS